MDVKDNNGAKLNDGDSVILIQEVKIKGTAITLRRGRLIKGIRLTDRPGEVDCRVDGTPIVLKTSFLRKA